MITARELDVAPPFTIAMMWELGIEKVMDGRVEARGRDLVERIRARMPDVLRELLDGIGDSAAASSFTVRREPR